MLHNPTVINHSHSADYCHAGSFLAAVDLILLEGENLIPVEKDLWWTNEMNRDSYPSPPFMVKGLLVDGP